LVLKVYLIKLKLKSATTKKTGAIQHSLWHGTCREHHGSI